MKVSLRRFAPLVAVLVLLGPAPARAASPAPDAAPTVAGLAPDPVPRTAPPATGHAARPAAPREIAAVSRPVLPAVEQPKEAPLPVVKPKPKPRPQHPHPVRIVDVVPLRVDVHRELGAIAAPARDDRLLALAAGALLAAVTAAASGAALTRFARRPA